MMTNEDILEKLESLEGRIKALEQRTAGVSFGTVTVDTTPILEQFVRELETRGIRVQTDERPDDSAEGVPA